MLSEECFVKQEYINEFRDQIRVNFDSPYTTLKN